LAGRFPVFETLDSITPGACKVEQVKFRVGLSLS
jgi:hypothetical protein